MYKQNENKDKQWIDVENEHFIIWMNMELFSDFIKRWGYIDKDLKRKKQKNDYNDINQI